MSSSSVPSIHDVAPVCAAHPGRPSTAVCRLCLAASCGECVTRVDGVNHCAACLARNFPARRGPPEMFRRIAARTTLPGSGLRVSGALALYFAIAFIAASFGVAMPFFANERLLESNRDRMGAVHYALSSYFDDTGHYPSRERGLAALLLASADDRDEWKGPYTVARAPSGRPALVPGDESKVIDVFGRPIFFYVSQELDDPSDPESLPRQIYIASRGANGLWDTAGIDRGNPPREPAGDDAIQWIAWP